MIILGIETSCDECSIALVEDAKYIHSNIIASQIVLHKPYNGVVPEIASRLHVCWIRQVFEAALKKADISLDKIDGIAVTSHPGLLGSLLVGVNFAKGLALGLNKPLVGIDHIRAHLFAPQIEHSMDYPYLGVLLSGGHTFICNVLSYDKIEILGSTVDDAIGEAYDKVAKHYNLGYPGGVIVDSLAQKGDPMSFMFPGSEIKKPLHKYDVSFSGLKTAVINQLQYFSTGKEVTNENICASFQRVAVGMIMKRVRKALKDTGLKRVSAGGGVSANSLIRASLLDLRNDGYDVSLASLKLCTDNAAMVAGLGYMYLKDGITSSLELDATSSFRL